MPESDHQGKQHLVQGVWGKNQADPHQSQHAFQETRAQHQNLLVKASQTSKHAGSERSITCGQGRDPTNRQGVQTKRAQGWDDEGHVQAWYTQVQYA